MFTSDGSSVDKNAHAGVCKFEFEHAPIDFSIYVRISTYNSAMRKNFVRKTRRIRSFLKIDSVSS